MAKACRRLLGLAALCAAVALGAAGCGSGNDSSGSPGSAGASGSTTTSSDTTPGASAALPRGREHVSIDPAEFTTKIDNPYFPMEPGNHWVYREVENGEVQRVDVTVTNRTKVVDGVETRVVHDLVTRRSEPVEDTYDWYAQDSQGNLWYFGENTAEYKNGKVATRAGSFEAGNGGAEPGVIMPANPEVGMSYREELLAGEAEDRARITGTDEKVTVPFDGYDRVVTTANTTPLEPKILERKWYAPGVGPVREDLVSGGRGRTELIRFTPSS